MDHKMWRAEYGSFPEFECPTCHRGKLHASEKHLLTLETRQARIQRETLDGQNWDFRKFTTFLICDFGFCGEVVVVGGVVAKVSQDLYDEGTDEVVFNSATFYRPAIMTPAPHVINVSKNLDKVCAQHLRKSFDLLWVDPASCANRIRVFIEALMDRYGIERTGINKKGEVYDLSLYARIRLLEANKPGHEKTFQALRNVGNFASHQGKAKLETLVDCYEILEEVLADLVDGKKSRIEGIIAKLSVKEGDF